MRLVNRRSVFLSILPLSAAALLAGTAQGLFGSCGPFTDVAADAFCPFVQEIFFLGITTGTTPTTYDPGGNVTRLQMAAFLSRSVDGVLKRGSRRAALNRFWTPQNETLLETTTVGDGPNGPASDGLDVWVPGFSGTVSRVRSSDGRLLETWTGATLAVAALSAAGKIFVIGHGAPGSLYGIDPREPAGSVTTVASNLGNQPKGIAFDGARIWTANEGNPGPGSISIVTPGASIPWTVTTLTPLPSAAIGALFDGNNIWVAYLGRLFRLDSSGAILQTVTGPTGQPIFDGTNIWVPAFDNSVWVVRAGNGSILANLTGNGLNGPIQAAFDGERVLVTNFTGSSVSLWKAADLSPIGSVPTGIAPVGACSDGLNFWITLQTNLIARF